MIESRRPILNKIARLWLWACGWQVKADLPDANKFVIVGGPHTSNWDFPYALAMFYTLNIKLSWMGKDALFKPPFGFIMRGLGGLAIFRNNNHGLVDQISEKFEQADNLIIGIAAKGTRKKTPYWKSGFYWIALKAQVPIVCCYLDYDNKVACIGLTIMPTGNITQDMNKIRAFYSGINGANPEYTDEIYLKEEEHD